MGEWIAGIFFGLLAGVLIGHRAAKSEYNRGHRERDLSNYTGTEGYYDEG